MINTRLLFLLFSIPILGCHTSSNHAQNNVHQQYTNNLINESSPYLLQHAHNPVNWNPWAEEALERAKKEDKLLIISIGYAACHWCHVMEHESFEDTAVAKIMNEHFIPIKVDREERPDVDDVYMTACHMATGQSCGWPLNAFALPDGRPVWAGTYFPKKQWIEILEYFVEVKEKEKDKLEEYASQLTNGIQTQDKIEFNKEGVFEAATLEQISAAFFDQMDFKKGGRKGSPKFPMPNNYEYLLDYHFRTGNQKALDAVLTTLDNMAMGGIYDHLGGGFARYSTDENWLVPHFEKMLYDNGQLISLYAKAYQLTKKPLYKEVVEETLKFIERELTNDNGAFYSSLDADSEGEEGKFYVWQKGEIDSILADSKLSELFSSYFDVTEKGNWEHKNILYRDETLEAVAEEFGMSETEVKVEIKKAKFLLLNAREKRIRPGLDDKALTSWNALMLKGYLDAYKAFGKKEYLDVALKNAAFISDYMLQDDFRLNRNFKDGKSVINAFLDDYALTIHAFLSLYEVTFDENWLEKAEGLAMYVKQHFYNAEQGMFHYTSDLDPPLVARKMELADNVIPSSNSLLARGLYYLGTYTYNTEYIEQAKQMLRNMLPLLTDNPQPSFYSNWLILYSDILQPPYEIAIVGKDFEKIRNRMQQNYLPNALFLGGKDEGSLELLKGKHVEGETMIYVCQNKVCKLPVTEVNAALALID